MNTRGPELYRDRESRRPLYVQVVSEPPLQDCWSVNVSSGGMGIIVTRDERSDTVVRGSLLTVEFALPDSGATVQAVARVAWRQEAERSADAPRGVAFGLLFEELESKVRLALARYLAGYRFHVAVAYALAAQRGPIERALGTEATVSFSTSDAVLEEMLSRGHVSAVLVCGSDPDTAYARIQHATTVANATLPDDAPPREWTPRIIYLGAAAPEQLVRAFNEGRLARALPPSADGEAIRNAVMDACRDSEMEREHRRTAMAQARASLRRQALSRPPQRLKDLVAQRLLVESQPMRAVLELIRTIAPYKVSVTLQGETGTGKEVLAHTLHDLSDRAHAPFVVQDCGTLTETLLESELFGHVKGAFTGAVTDHPGLFVMADGGTIFLDEIENTTPKLQAALLRVLETGEVRAVGGRTARVVDVRVVCASNRPLQEEVHAGRFRADLFYRLSAFPILVPPLRERRADILPLARQFLQHYLQATGKPEVAWTNAARAALEAHDWPGNVRELRNVVERAVILCAPGKPLGVEVLPPTVRAAPPAAGDGASLMEKVEQYERELIREALRGNQGVLRRAAAALGMNRVTLARKVRQHRLLKELSAREGATRPTSAR